MAASHVSSWSGMRAAPVALHVSWQAPYEPPEPAAAEPVSISGRGKRPCGSHAGRSKHTHQQSWVRDGSQWRTSLRLLDRSPHLVQRPAEKIVLLSLDKCFAACQRRSEGRRDCRARGRDSVLLIWSTSSCILPGKSALWLQLTCSVCVPALLPKDRCCCWCRNAQLVGANHGRPLGSLHCPSLGLPNASNVTLWQSGQTLHSPSPPNSIGLLMEQPAQMASLLAG